MGKFMHFPPLPCHNNIFEITGARVSFLCYDPTLKRHSMHTLKEMQVILG